METSLHSEETGYRARTARFGAAVALVAVLAIAVGVRVYGIGEESIWFDEGVSVQYLDRPTLAEFLQAERQADKLKLPLYFIIEYYWWHATGRSIVALRYLSVLIAAATAVVLFRFTSRPWGTHAAFLATLCFALSKPHVFHGQEIRMYGLMYLLALLSWSTLYIAVKRGGRGVWALNAGLNALLFATHLLGAVSIAAQAVFLFAEAPRRWKRYVAWGAAHALVMVPLVPWLTSFSEYDEAIAWISEPNARQLGNVSLFLLLGTKIDPGDPLSLVERVAAISLAILAYAAAAVAVVYAWRSAVDRTRLCLLVGWWLLPPLILLGASWAVQPCFVDRYMLYASFPLYMLLGRGITLAPRPWAAGASAALVLVYSYFAVAQPRPIRANLSAVAGHIAARIESGDAVFVRGKGPGNDICMRYYLGEHAGRVLDRSVELREAVRMVRGDRRVWFVIPSAADKKAEWIDDVLTVADRRGLEISQWEIPSFRPVHILLLTRPAGGRPSVEERVVSAN